MRTNATRFDGAHANHANNDTEATQQLAVTRVTTESQPQRMQDLPRELIGEIIANLPQADQVAVRNFAATCWQLHEITQHEGGKLAVMNAVQRVPREFVPGVTLPLFQKALAATSHMREEHAVAALALLIGKLPLLRQGSLDDWKKAFHALLTALPQQGKQGSPLDMQRQSLLASLAKQVAALPHPGMRALPYCALANAGIHALPQEPTLAQSHCTACVKALGESEASARKVEEHRNTILSAVSAIAASLYAFPVHEGKTHLNTVLGALGSLTEDEAEVAVGDLCLALQDVPPEIAAQYAPDLLGAALAQGGGEVSDALTWPLMEFASSYPADVQLGLFKRGWDELQSATDPGLRSDWAAGCMTSLNAMSTQVAQTCLPLVEAGMGKVWNAFEPADKPMALVLLVKCARHVPPERQDAWMQRVFAMFRNFRAGSANHQAPATPPAKCFFDIAVQLPQALAAPNYTTCALELAEALLRWPGATAQLAGSVYKQLALGLSRSDRQQRRQFFFELPARWHIAANATPRATVLALPAVLPVLLQHMAMLDPSDRSAWVRENIMNPGQQLAAQQQLNMLGILASVCGRTTDTEAALVSDMWKWLDQLQASREAGPESDLLFQKTRLRVAECLHLLPPDEQGQKFMSLWTDLANGTSIEGASARRQLLDALFTSSLTFKSPATMKMAADCLVGLLASKDGGAYLHLLAVLEALVSRLPGNLSDQLLVGLVELRDQLTPESRPRVEEAPPGEPRQ